VEPAAVLVGPFEVKVDRHAEVLLPLADAGVRDARVEPDVEDVGLLAERLPAARRAAGPGGRSSAASRSNQASAPSFSKKPATRSMSVRSRRWPPHPSHWKTAMGTPQDRCREMHQSGRFAIIPSIRSCPQAGIHRTCLMAARASARSPVRSIEMNHCFVARKMTGFLHASSGGRRGTDGPLSGEPDFGELRVDPGVRLEDLHPREERHVRREPPRVVEGA